MESQDPKDRVRRRHLRAGQRQLERDQNDREANARRKTSGGQISRKQARKQARRDANQQTRRARTEDDAHDSPEAWQPIRRSQPKKPPGRRRTGGTLAIVCAVHSAGRIEVLPCDPAEAPDAPAGIGSEPLSAEASLLSDQVLAVGDRVRVIPHGERVQAIALESRRSALSRTDPAHPQRRKLLAANVDVAVLTLAATPPPRSSWIDRLLVALAHSGIAPCVVVNKIDTVSPPERDGLWIALRPYRDQGIPTVLASATTGEGLDLLHAELRQRVGVLVGHSGVGKSSLANALDPAGDRAVGQVRSFDGKGRHTTTSSDLRAIGDGAWLIDTPGVREFGLGPVDRGDILLAFPDLERAAESCRFRDCQHLDEPDCNVRAMAEQGTIDGARYASYARILRSLDDCDHT